MIPRDIDDGINPNVDDEKPSLRRTDVQPPSCSDANKHVSTQDAVIGNVNENTAYANKDHNSVLCNK